MKNFALIGASGYVAPRHMKAIKATNNSLVAAMDPSDSVGIIDSYFPDAAFFTEFERFDRHIDKLSRQDSAVDYLSICSPNYLHDSHIRFGLKSGLDVICEKPLVLNPWNLDALLDIEATTQRKVYTILQLRHHPSVLQLKEGITQDPKTGKYKVKLHYITSRGQWYDYSWKGDHAKSGGIATNIGIHFFDMLIWLFGSVQHSEVVELATRHAKGNLSLQHADVEWFLSINKSDLPASVVDKPTYRSITIDGKELEFSGGFTDLHTTSYQAILDGKGYGLSDALPSIQLVNQIRNHTTT